MSHRLAGAGLVFLLLLGLAIPVIGATSTAAEDSFSDGDYSGGSGWTTNWSEVGGESDGPDQGQVQVEGSPCASDSCLTITATLLGLSSPGAERTAATSGSETITLSFDFDADGGLLGIEGHLRVQAWVDGSLQLDDNVSNQPSPYVLPGGNEVRVRFRTEGLAVGGTVGIDNVKITVTTPDPTTTTSSTTTTKPTTTSSTTGSSTTTSPTTSTTTTEKRAGTTTTSTTRHTTTTTEPTTTTETVARRSTTTTASDGGDTTTTTVAARDLPSTTATSPARDQGEEEPPPRDPDGQSPDERAITALPPSQTSGVVTDLDPGLSPRGTVAAANVGARDGFLVQFLVLAEDISLDILANAVLGVVLAWTSLKGLGRSG